MLERSLSRQGGETVVTGPLWGLIALLELEVRQLCAHDNEGVEEEDDECDFAIASASAITMLSSPEWLGTVFRCRISPAHSCVLLMLLIVSIRAQLNLIQFVSNSVSEGVKSSKGC